MDRYWNVLLTNESAPRFFNCFIDMSKRKGPRNMLHLMFDPAGMRPFVDNWEDVANSLIYRVNAEAIGGVIDDRTKELLAALLAYPEVRSGQARAEKAHSESTQSDRGSEGLSNDGAGFMPVSPVIPISFRKGSKVLNYFSMVTAVGTPQTLAAQELRIESMFPADETTEHEHVLMLGVAAADSP